MNNLRNKHGKTIDQALSKCLVIDTETTNLNFDKAEICELGIANNQKGRSQLFGTHAPIPFAASSKNNISRSMLESQPTIDSERGIELVLEMLAEFDPPKYLVAHNSRYDQEVIKRAFLNNEIASQMFHQPWICTYRLARHIIDESSIREDDCLAGVYSLNYLRYALDLQCSGVNTYHRALDDCMVTVELFAYLLYQLEQTYQTNDSDVLLDLAYEIARSRIPISTWPIGTHKGKLLSQLPDSYFSWAIVNLDILNEDSVSYDWDLTQAVIEEVQRRGIV
jgi:DNA polymerase-3 subunit epsilon